MFNFFSNKKLEKIFKSIVVAGCYLVVFIPLVLVPSSYFPYIIQKTLIFRILIEFLFGCYLVLALMNPDYRPKKSAILFWVLGFFGVMLVATFTSQSVFRSWWGNWERMFGTFNYLHYLLWFIMLAGVFKSLKNWSYLLSASLLVSLAVSLYSIGQRFSLGFTFQAGLERVNGTIGNAAFLATYLLFHLFIALLFIFEKQGKFWKLFYAFIFVIDFFVLVLTGTRGAILALGACLPALIALLFYLKVKGEGLAKKIMVIAGILIIVSGGLYYFRHSAVIENNYWLHRLTNYSLTDNTVQTRLRSWSWGLKGFRDNLLFGLGPENYQIAFNRYFTGDFYDYTGQEIWFDRAHNFFVDLASTMGIFGLIAYLGVFAAIFYALKKLYKENLISVAVFIVIFLLFFSYFVQNMFVFDSQNSLIPFYLLLAYVACVYQRAKPAEQPVKGKIRLSPLITSSFALAGFLLLLFKVNISEVKANLLVYNAYVRSGYYHDYEGAVSSYKQAYDLAVNKIDPAILFSTSLSELIVARPQGVSPDRQIKDYRLNIDWMDKAISLDKENMFLYYLQSKNYTQISELTREVEDIQKGINYARKANQLSPENVRPLWILAQLYLYGSQPQMALDYLLKAQKINDKLPETHFYLSVVYQNLGNTEKAEEQYDRMIDHGFTFANTGQINALIPRYELNNDVKRLVYLYKRLTLLDPQNPDYWKHLIANELKSKDSAVFYNWDLAVKALPDFEFKNNNLLQELIKLKNENN